jgi:hypothetical protein
MRLPEMDRRRFLQWSAASYLALSEELKANPAKPVQAAVDGDLVKAAGHEYAWTWHPETDQFRLLDRWGLEITTGKLQPVVVVESGGRRKAASGKALKPELEGNLVRIRYEGVNGSGLLSMAWRFEDEGFWLEPVVYESSVAEDVVSLHYFASAAGDTAQPMLQSHYFVLPGVSETSALSPILHSDFGGAKIDATFWVGRGWTGGPGILQAWGLPVHYFCGYHRSPYDYQRTPSVKLPPVPPEQLLSAFCCGLAELPSGDLFLDSRNGLCSLIVSYRGDLWRHLRGPGRMTLGAKLFWTVGPNYYEAIRQYYRGLLRAGAIPKKINSPRKNAVALAPSFCTWGDQVARDQIPDNFDEPTLLEIYERMKASGINVKMFSIDGYWEGKYGSLRHSEERFPHFDDFLARLRADGRYVGLWSAFMRCEDPAEIGLKVEHMLRRPDGKPFFIDYGSNSANAKKFYILDITQPAVQRVVQELARRFIKRYQPDFVKFDFGYELPSLAAAAPQDMTWAGERLLFKAMEIIVKAMREVNPDIVVMYYSLSPLFIEYFDLHSPDDLGYCAGDFDLEANRRFFFSSLLGEIGMPTWGSSGYEWTTSPNIWFDSAAIGTLGSLGSFYGPDPDALATPARVAKYDGLSHALRSSETFSIIPVDAAYHGPARGAHISSWARMEKGEVVLVALRQHRWDGLKGSGKYRELVSANASVVVASRDGQGISRAARLAIVPFGDGELMLKREFAETEMADVTEHFFRGEPQTRTIELTGGELHLPLRERNQAGAFLEWIEVRFLT